MTTFQDVHNRINTADRDYTSNWVIPVSNAYVTAHGEIKKRLAQVKAREKAAAELMVTALSLGMGAGLGVLFAKTTAKSLVSQAAMNYAIKNRTTTAANMILGARRDTAISFLFSEGWDQAEKKLNKKAQSYMTQLMTSDPGILSALIDPQIFQNHMSAYLKKALSGIEHTLYSLEAAGLSPEAENVQATRMINSPILANMPSRSTIGEKTRAAWKVEFAIYMAYIMDGDSWQTQEGTMMWQSPAPKKSTPVAISYPTTDRRYPKPYREQSTSGSGAATQVHLRSGQVVYRQPADEIQERIDTLYGSIYPTQKGFFEGISDREELIRAETLYEELTMPMAIGS